MMSGFHGLFSVGGIVGALSVSSLLFLGASPLIATLAVVGVILALLAGFGKHLLPYGSHGGEARLILPRGPVLTLGLLCFITFLAEGAMLDWSAVFLTSRRGVTPGQAGFGYAVFAIAMTLGRLNGDRCVQALGGKRILLFGSLCAAAGLAVAVLVPIPAQRRRASATSMLPSWVSPARSWMALHGARQRILDRLGLPSAAVVGAPRTRLLTAPLGGALVEKLTVMRPSSWSRYIVSMRAWIWSYRACSFLIVCVRAACSV